MSDQDQPQYRPGTIVNGHVLTADGEWVPVHQSQAGQGPSPQRKKMSGGRKLGIVLGVGFLLLVGCVAVVANVGDDVATTEPDSTASAPAAGDQPRPPGQEDNPAVSQGIGSQDASGDVELGQATESPDPLNTQYVPVKITNNSEKRSNYWIEIAADRPNGSRITTTTVFAQGLEPGQTTEQHADFYTTERLPADTVFNVLTVERTASV
jgi:hypothetical protein